MFSPHCLNSPIMIFDFKSGNMLIFELRIFTRLQQTLSGNATFFHQTTFYGFTCDSKSVRLRSKKWHELKF